MTDSFPDPPPEPSLEPSVLDYLKSQLPFGRGGRIRIPSNGDSVGMQVLTTDPGTSGQQTVAIGRFLTEFPWRSLTALGLALLAQSRYEPPRPSASTGSLLYMVALGFLLWSVVRGEWNLTPQPVSLSGTDPFHYRRVALIASVPFAALAFLSFSGNLFTTTNVALWLIVLGLFVWSLWLPNPSRPSLWTRGRDLLGRGAWEIRIDRWALLVLAAAAIVMAFRLYAIDRTPAEPFSDHAEKLLDVYDVSQGQTHIFFPRNTGREALQMYWTLLVGRIFGTGLSFFTLKLGTVLIGLFTLPYLYLLGREVSGSRVGLFAFLLAGIGYWPNVISRVGLRFPLYPLFVAAMLVHLLRGLRTRNRNDFILAGIFLGLGLHGYSPFRIVPLLVIGAFLVYVLHDQARGTRRAVLFWLVILAVSALMVFLPLLRYATENPDSFSYRAFSRMGSIEQSLPGPWLQVLLSNTWNALRMFNWNNGTIWVHSLPNRPALEPVTGALFLIGIVLILVRYLRERHWLDLFILLSIPILLLPSILSLAFPGENPSLNRTAGALVPVFIISAMALDGLVTAFGSDKRRTAFSLALITLLLWVSASQNFDLVFRQFDRNFRNGAWNSSEMGAIIKQFGLVYGETDTAWVVPFPHWVDTRLVGVWAGIPNRDFAMWTEELPKTIEFSGPKLFIVKANLKDPAANDQRSVDALRALYPGGSLGLHRADVPGHDFWVYFVPALSLP